MATRKAHWDKPIWVTEGGAELPVLNIAISAALMIREPDRYSLDRLLGDPPAALGGAGRARRGHRSTAPDSSVVPSREQAHEEAHEEETQDEAREELAGP